MTTLKQARRQAKKLMALKKRTPRHRPPVLAKRRRPLTEETVRRIVDKMPGGLHGYCKTWGWLTFARRIEQAHKIR